MLARIALIAALAALCGCASKATMDARYDASLQRWQGATRAELEAGWGRPRLAQDLPGGQVLTWTVRVDVDDRDVRGAAPSVAVARGTPGGGGVNGVGSAVVNTGALAPATVPIMCTTHFTLKDGRVVSWTFEGLGCGAPT